MKRILLALLAALLIAPMGGAWAETAADITGRCVVTAAPGAKGKENLRDASYLTYYTGRYLEIRTPEESPCFGLYICFSGVAAPYRVLSPGADRETPHQARAAELGLKIGTFPTGTL